MVKKRNFLFISLFILTISFVLGIGAPTGINVEDNTTANYDKEGIFTVNWSAVSEAGNYTIYIYADDVLFKSINNDSATGYSFSNTTDANYTFTIESVNASDSTDRANSTNISIIVDDTNPSLSYNSPSNDTGANRTWIFVNVSTSDTNSDSLVFSLYNSTGLVNQTIYTYTTTTINWTGLSNNETYHFNVTANDSATNSVSAETRTFYLDGTNPTISSFTLSDTSVGIDDTINSTCTATDNLDPSVSTSVTGIDTSSLGTKTATCTATDSAGNSVTSTVDYTVSTSGSNTNDDSGGSTPFWITTYVEDDKDLSEKKQVNKQLLARYRIKLKVENETHYVGLVELTDTKATINVSSEDQQAILSIGDTQKFEVSGDNIYDLSVTLEDINTTTNKANLTIISISEEIPAVLETGTSANVTGEGDTTTSEKKGKTWLWIVIALIVVGGVIFFLKYKKGKRFKLYGY